MKNQFLMALAMVFALVVSSCKKDELVDAGKPVVIELAEDETSIALADSLGDFMENPIISEATEDLDAEIMSVPEILDTDYFMFVETRGGRKDSMVKSCSGVLNLTRDQKASLAKLHAAKMECMKDNREILNRLDGMARNYGKELRHAAMEKHKNQVESIMKSFRNGDITEKERDTKMAAARKTLKESLSKIRAAVHAKIKSAIERLEAAGKIKNCERQYLDGVMDVLGRADYAKWVRCHKMQVRKGGRK